MAQVLHAPALLRPSLRLATVVQLVSPSRSSSIGQSAQVHSRRHCSFGGDFTAALTLTSLIVPQSISYATSLANLPVASGLYGAAIPALVYSLLGTSRQMSVGPEAALTLIIVSRLSMSGSVG